MRKLVAGLAITLDGVVDSPSGNWMRFDDEMTSIIADGIAQADAILLGRRTYLQFADMWPKLGTDVPMADFMNNTRKYVVSNTITDTTWANSTVLRGDLTELVTKLKQAPGRNIQIPGSPRLVWSLIHDGLLDELSLMLHPVIIGHGRRLFEDATAPVHLNLVDERALASGVVMLTYTNTPKI